MKFSDSPGVEANRLIVYWAPVFLLCILIFINSSRPYPESIPQLPFLDKGIHFLVYGLLGALFFRALRDRREAANRIYPLIFAIGFTALYGASDELHQSLVPERVADGLDLAADILGGAAGALVYRRFLRWFYASFPRHSHIDKIENFI